jgi:hypothetical protein
MSMDGLGGGLRGRRKIQEEGVHIRVGVTVTVDEHVLKETRSHRRFLNMI